MQNILSELVPGMQQQPSSTDLPYWFGNWAAAAGTAQTANYRLKLAASLNLVICSGGSGRSGKIEEKSTEVWIRIFFKIKITTKTVFLSICRSPSFLLPINSSSSSKGSYDVFFCCTVKNNKKKNCSTFAYLIANILNQQKGDRCKTLDFSLYFIITFGNSRQQQQPLLFMAHF